MPKHVLLHKDSIPVRTSAEKKINPCYRQGELRVLKINVQY